MHLPTNMLSATLATMIPARWVVLALTVAVVEALKDFYAKRAAVTLSTRATALSINLFALPLTLVFAYSEPLPAVDHRFFLALSAAALLHFCAVGLYMFALRHSDLAVTLPMISFTPLFLLVTTPIMLGQWPSAQGGVGVIFIVAGAYLLNIGDRANGLFEPFRALVREQGARAMLLVAVVWSITANVDPIGIHLSNRPWWLVAVVSTLTCMFGASCSAEDRRAVIRNGNGWTAGIFNGVSLLLYLYAITIGPLPYVLALKRLSILVGMLLGALFLGEQRWRERIFGATVMIMGVVVISTSP